MSTRCLLAPHAPGCDQVDDTVRTTNGHTAESELGGHPHLRREIAVGRIALVERVCKPWPKAAIQCHLLPFAAAKSSGSLQSHPWARVGRLLPSCRHLVVRNRQARCRRVPWPKAAIQCHLLPFAAAKSSGSLQLIASFFALRERAGQPGPRAENRERGREGGPVKPCHRVPFVP